MFAVTGASWSATNHIAKNTSHVFGAKETLATHKIGHVWTISRILHPLNLPYDTPRREVAVVTILIQ